MRPTSIAIRRASRLRRAPTTIFSRKCLRCACATPSSSIFTTTRALRPAPLPLALRHEQRRGFFFGIFSSKDTDPVQERGHDPNPGYTVLGSLVRYLDTKVGFLPGTSDLVTAFEQIILGDRRLILTPGVAYGLCRMFDVLLERGDTGQLDLEHVHSALKNIQTGTDSIHIKLGAFLFDHLYEYDKDDGMRLQASSRFVNLLSRHRKFDMATMICKQAAEESDDSAGAALTWLPLMDAYVEEGDEAGLLKLMDMMKEVGAEPVDQHYGRLLSLYMRKNDLPKVKEVYDQLADSQVRGVHPGIYKDIMEFYFRRKDQPGVVDWGNDVLRGLLATYSEEGNVEIVKLEDEQNKQLWDLALQWCAAAGRSVDEIERLMSTVSKHPASGFQPDIETVNGLVEFSLERNDAYKAERLASLAGKWRFQPNRRSLVLQIHTRILGGDVEGACTSWRDLRFHEDPSEDQGLETLALLRALCKQPNANAKSLQEVYDSIRERKIPLDVETLCIYLKYMMQDLDIMEFVDVLTRDVQQFLPEERNRVVNAIYEHIAAESTSEGDAWELYKVTRDVIVEMSLEIRKKIMNVFFKKGRVDMGSVVFTHMRHSMHSRADKQAYIECFQGVAQSRDGRILMEMVNLLKIDPELELDTELRNAVLWGYKLCGFPYKGLEIYDDIRRSQEGPDSDTLSAVIATCGEIPNGMVVHGEKIWRDFAAMGFEYTEHNYSMYLEAWINNGHLAKAFKLARNMEANMNIRPGRFTLYTLYTEMPPTVRPEILEWIDENYKQEWEQLLADPEQPIQKYHEHLEKVAEQRRQEEIENDL